MINNWDDIRFVLAVAEAGSLSGAARQLGVNHATVLRRINAYEASSGVVLFERSARGLKLAPNRRRVLDGMRDMREATKRVNRALTATQTELSGKVRITSTDTFCQAVLPPVLGRIIDLSEALSVELNSANQHVSLAELDADIAIRPAFSLPADLVGQQAGRLGFAVYGTATGRARWLAFSGALLRSMPAAWLANMAAENVVSDSADSFVVLREMAAAGLGWALLPVVLGGQDARLKRLDRSGFGLPEDLTVPIWVASHKDLAEVPRIKLVREVLTAALLEDTDRITGLQG